MPKATDFLFRRQTTQDRINNRERRGLHAPCPHCGAKDYVFKVMKGKNFVYLCNSCKKTFELKAARKASPAPREIPAFNPPTGITVAKVRAISNLVRRDDTTRLLMLEALKQSIVANDRFAQSFDELADDHLLTPDDSATYATIQ